jgi:hypothetical protein
MWASPGLYRLVLRGGLRQKFRHRCHGRDALHVTKHIGAFVEYKYNHQWTVEIEDHPFYLPNGTVGRGMATLDFDVHKVVMGLTYHW